MVSGEELSDKNRTRMNAQIRDEGLTPFELNANDLFTIDVEFSDDRFVWTVILYIDGKMVSYERIREKGEFKIVPILLSGNIDQIIFKIKVIGINEWYLNYFCE